MIVPMVRVRVLGPRSRLPDAIRALQVESVLHLATQPERPQLQAFSLAPADARRRRQLTSILQDVEASLSGMGNEAVAVPAKTGPAPNLPHWARLARRVRRQVAVLSDRSAAMDEEEALLARYRGLFSAYESLLRSHGVSSGVSAFHIVLRADQADTLPHLQQALEQLLGGAVESFAQRLPGGEIGLLILVPGSEAARVDKLLAETRVQEIPVPAGYGSSLLEAIPRMREREVALPREREALRRGRTALARAHGAELTQARSALRDLLLQMESMALSSVTAHAFVIEGWLPAAAEPRLASVLDRAFAGEVVVEVVGREHWRADEAPVVLRNPRLFRPFETLSGMVPLPRYGTLDPTPFVAVFFPMFFGLIMGDVGYGVVLASLAGLLHWRSRPGSNLRAISEVGGACALFTIVFGVLFGEYFGDLGQRWLGLRPVLMDRAAAIIPFLCLAIALGLVHVLLGLILGVLNSARHHPRLAVGRGLSALMIVLIIAALLAAIEVFPHSLLTPMVVGLLVAFPILVVVEGVVAPVELLSTLGHILSYARIMALGTASVMLAIVANKMAGAVGSVVVGVLFALLFHLVNFGLGLFTPTIHALRLHFVEFFGTFYSPGGVRYHPLGHWRPDTGRND